MVSTKPLPMPTANKFRSRVQRLSKVDRELYTSLVQIQLKLQSIDTSLADEWSACIKEFLTILGASEAAATELAVMIKQYLSFPIRSSDPSMTNDLTEELNRLQKNVQGWNFDRAVATRALEEKLRKFSQSLSSESVGGSHETALRRGACIGDEGQAEHIVSVPESMNSEDTMQSGQMNIDKQDPASKRGMMSRVFHRGIPLLSQKGLGRRKSQLKDHAELAAIRKDISIIQSKLRKLFKTLKSLYSDEKTKLDKELKRTISRLPNNTNSKSSVKSRATPRANSPSEAWEMKANILLEDYAKAPHRTITTVRATSHSSERAPMHTTADNSAGPLQVVAH